MACTDSVLESFIVTDVATNNITINDGDTLLVQVGDTVDSVTQISTASGNLHISLAPNGVTATPATPYSIYYDGTLVRWNPTISTDAGNLLTIGADSGLFVDIAAIFPSPLFNINDGTTTLGMDVGDTINFISTNGSLGFTVTPGSVNVDSEVQLSATAGNTLVANADGLYVPQVSVTEVETIFTDLGTGVQRYTNEKSVNYDLDFNASALPALDNNNILGGGAGASANIQLLLDQLSTVISGTDVLTTLGYNAITNELTYVDEIAGTTVLNLTSAAGLTDVQGLNNAVMNTVVTGSGTAVDPYIVEAQFNGALNDLSDVVAPTPTIGQVLTYTGTSWQPQSSPSVLDRDSYILDVRLSGTNLVFSEGGDGNAFSGSVDLSPIASTADNYVSTVSFDGTNLNFVGVNTGFNGAVDISALASGGYSWSIEDNNATVSPVADTETVTIQSGTDLLQTDLTIGGAGPVLTINLNTTGAVDGAVPTYNAAGTDVVWQIPTSGGGGMTSFTISGDSGTDTITDTENINFVGGTGLTTAITAGTVTLTSDLSLVELNDVPAYPLAAGDYVLSYNFGTGLNTWVDQTTLGGGGTADGVITNVALAGTDLNFTGTAPGFNGTVDLSTLVSAADATTASNGLTEVGDDIRLGGDLIANTQINTQDFELEFIVAAEVPGGADNNGKIVLGNAASDYMLHIEGTTAAVEDKTLLYVDGKEPAAGYPTMKLDATVDNKTVNEPILEIRHTGTVGATPTGYLMTAYGDLDGGTTQDLVFSIRADGQLEAADEVILTGLQDHADDTAAGVAGLVSGQVYFTTATTAVGDIAIGDKILKIKA